LTLAFLGIACETISNSTFQGLGKPFAAFWLTGIRMFVFAVPLSYLAVYKLSLGMTGIFFSLVVAYIATAIISVTWVNYKTRQLSEADGG
jgi:Na+-driven multidrug efflux pump